MLRMVSRQPGLLFCGRTETIIAEVSSALQSAVDSIDESDTSLTKIDRLAQRILQDRSAWLQSYILTRSLSDVLKKVVTGQAGYDQQTAARLIEVSCSLIIRIGSDES
jgi:uncharacterized protein HemY